MFIVWFFLCQAGFQISALELPELDSGKIDSLLARLPYDPGPQEQILLRGKEPMLEVPIVHAGGYFRYAFDLYQLSRDHYGERIKSNLEALAAELELIGDQGKTKSSRRIEEVKDIEKAIEDGLEPDTVLKLFAYTETEIRTIVAEYGPEGVYAFDLGSWTAAMGTRLAFYPGCTDDVCQTLVLSNINLLIEMVQKLDSEHWNQILLELPRGEGEGARKVQDVIATLEFISALPYYPPVTGEAVGGLLEKLLTLYKIFDLEFIA